MSEHVGRISLAPADDLLNHAEDRRLRVRPLVVAVTLVEELGNTAAEGRPVLARRSARRIRCSLRREPALARQGAFRHVQLEIGRPRSIVGEEVGALVGGPRALGGLDAHVVASTTVLRAKFAMMSPSFVSTSGAAAAGSSHAVFLDARARMRRSSSRDATANASPPQRRFVAGSTVGCIAKNVIDARGQPARSSARSTK